MSMAGLRCLGSGPRLKDAGPKVYIKCRALGVEGQGSATVELAA